MPKRYAEYVPQAIRQELNKLSKADLMEVAFDLALMISGEGEERTAYRTIRESAKAIATSQGRTTPNFDRNAHA